MTSLADLSQEAGRRHLRVTAGLDSARCATRSDLPGGTRTLILLSPDEPGFWPAFTASEEYRDGAPDPMDRWSRRIIGSWADQIGATPLYQRHIDIHFAHVVDNDSDSTAFSVIQNLV